jgi:hypothetical protein
MLLTINVWFVGLSPVQAVFVKLVGDTYKTAERASVFRATSILCVAMTPPFVATTFTYPLLVPGPAHNAVLPYVFVIVFVLSTPSVATVCELMSHDIPVSTA